MTEIALLNTTFLGRLGKYGGPFSSKTQRLTAPTSSAAYSLTITTRQRLFSSNFDMSASSTSPADACATAEHHAFGLCLSFVHRACVYGPPAGGHRSVFDGVWLAWRLRLTFASVRSNGRINIALIVSLLLPCPPRQASLHFRQSAEALATFFCWLPAPETVHDTCAAASSQSRHCKTSHRRLVPVSGDSLPFTERLSSQSLRQISARAIILCSGGLRRVVSPPSLPCSARTPIRVGASDRLASWLDRGRASTFDPGSRAPLCKMLQRASVKRYSEPRIATPTCLG